MPLIKIGLALGLIPGLISAAVAMVWAAAIPVLGSALPPVRYDTCAQLRQTFSTGLAATDAASKNSVGAPRVYPQAYVLNMHLDKDRDGAICASPSR